MDMIDSLLKQIDEYIAFEASKEYKLQIFQDNCILIRNGLSNNEQCLLYHAVQKAALQCPNSSVTQSLKNTTTATKLMSINVYNTDHNNRMSPIFMKLQSKIRKILATETNINITNQYKAIFIKSLKYNVLNGRLDKHCDDVNGFVFIYSLGNTANFFVNDKHFEFCSGDVLIFDASKKAKIFHGVESIKEYSYPIHMQHLKDFRISVQIRCQKQKKLKVKSEKIEKLMLKLDDLR